MSETFTREQLYELVWDIPKRTLADRLGVSDVAIGKACRKAGIPVPERGYWARKDAGKPAVRQPLPPRFPGQSNTIEIGAGRFGYWSASTPDLINDPLPPRPEFSESVESVRGRITKMVGKVPYPTLQSRQHPLVAKLLAQDQERQLEFQKHRYFWDQPHFDSVIERRRLRIFNAIFLVLQRLSCKPDMTTSKHAQNHDSATMRVGDTHTGFIIKMITKSSGKRKNAEAGASRLILALTDSADESYGKSEWQDGDGVSIEQALNDIVVSIIVAAEIKYRSGELKRHAWLVRRREQILEEERQRAIAQERADRERRDEEERKRVQKLLDDADALLRADKIRDYVRIVLASAETITTDNRNIETWASWALAQADNIDPTKNLSFLSVIDSGAR